MTTTITDVFFDLDHTLWDFDNNSTLAFDKIFKSNYPSIATEQFIEHYVPINQACWKLYQNDQINHTELRYKRLSDSFKAMNISISDEVINQMAHDYITYLPENNLLFEGTLEILEYLQPKYQLHIITNGFAAVQEKKIRNSGLNKYFKTVTNSELAGVKKPNSLIFDYAINAAKTTKSASIMIGDCIDADVNGALNYGLDAIFFNQNKIEVPQHIKQINHLLEIKKYL